MKFFIVYLVLLMPFYNTAEGLVFNWRNALPWAKDIPKEDYKKNVEIHIVKKDWKPQGANIPNDEFLTRYSGTVGDVYKMFRDIENQYEYYTKPLEKGVDILSEEYGYDQNLESIFVIHTISGNAHEYFVKNIMIALSLRNFMKRYNVFAFNMPGMQASMEQTIVKSIYGRKANFEAFGETIGDFFDSAIKQNLIRPDQVHFLGFCYSSQLAGNIARYIYSNNNNQKVKSILALDPYSIGFSGIRNKVISKDDAQVVYAYHTNSMAYGTFYRKATADISFNSGFSQPGCYTSTNVMCSHRRAVTAFWYVILYPELWLVRKCSSWLMFKTCLCSKKETARLEFPPSPGLSGKYYMNTMSNKPYGYGAPGANCYTKNNSDKKNKEKYKQDIDFSRSKSF